jgi:hypothetical protein
MTAFLSELERRLHEWATTPSRGMCFKITATTRTGSRFSGANNFHVRTMTAARETARRLEDMGHRTEITQVPTSPNLKVSD